MAKYLTSKNLALVKVLFFVSVWGFICALSAAGWSYFAPMRLRPLICVVLFTLSLFSLDIRVSPREARTEVGA